MWRWLALGLLMIIIGLGLVVMCVPGVSSRAYSTLQQDNLPRQPVQIADRLYYVGASDIASFLIETDAGLILIDGGYAETAPLILENIEALGYTAEDVEVLLNTQSHFDHAAGLAAIKEATGATLYATEIAASALARGGREDFAFGNAFTYRPVFADIILEHGQSVTLGDRTLTLQFTPGHTRGCTSWSFSVDIGGTPYPALLVCSLSMLNYQLVGDKAAYPGIADDFALSLDRLEALPCSVFLAPHAQQFGLDRKTVLAEEIETAFVDPAGCAAYLALSRRTFESRLAQQTRAQQ